MPFPKAGDPLKFRRAVNALAAQSRVPPKCPKEDSEQGQAPPAVPPLSYETRIMGTDRTGGFQPGAEGPYRALSLP